jgi:uncharacterized protein (DUF4415 family)
MRENREHTTRLSSAEARAKAPAAKREGADALAASIEQILAAQRAGATNLSAIVDALNARGVATATGKRWEAATVASVLNVLARIEGQDETDYARLEAMTDADIAQAVAEDPDAPPLDLDWTQARLILPPGKDIVTLRLDRDVLEWFRGQGPGYQTRINQALRAFYEARRNQPTDAGERVRADLIERVKASGRRFERGGRVGQAVNLDEAPREAGGEGDGRQTKDGGKRSQERARRGVEPQRG